MDLETGLAFAHTRTQGVLTTIRKDGRPQPSNILFVMDGDMPMISVTDTRAKTKNLRRDPRATLCIPGDDFWTFVVLDGTVTLSDVARDVNDDVVEALVSYYRNGAGEHPDWDDFRSTMVREGRVLATFHATSAYGILGS